MNKNNTCKVNGCESSVRYSGMCVKHYQRWTRKGSTDSVRDLTVEERFWIKVEKTEGCWNWIAGKRGQGYGAYSVGPRATRKLVPAHRFSYELANGPIPEGMVVDHICHNPSCVRPDHLRLGTQKQNAENQKGVSRANKSSGIRNVHRSGSKSKPWSVNIRHHRKMYHFGVYATLEEAEAVAIRERSRLFTFAD